MLFKVYNYFSAAWVDISDYVVGSSEIPFISRNSDYTLRADTWTMEIAGSIQVDLVGGYRFAADDKIKIEKDSAFLKGGYIESSYYNYDRQVFVLTIKSSLFKLQDKMLGYTEFGAAFATGSGTQFWEEYLASYPSVQVLWALEKVFAGCSLTLTVPNGIKTEVLFTRAAGTNWDGRVITRGDLYFDENQLFCLGMQAAVNPVTIVNTGVLRTNYSLLDLFVGLQLTIKNTHDPEVDCFAFVSEVLTSLKLTLDETDFDTFTLTAPTASYTIADDDKYGYESTGVTSKEKNVGYSLASYNVDGNWAIANSNRDKYASATETTPPEYRTSEDSAINMMINFRMLFADVANPAAGLYNESTCEPTASGVLIVDDGEITAHLNPLACRYAALAINKTVEDITTVATDTFATVVENFIDLENQTSRIIQETYA
jgi:hypothetical protein